MDSKLKLNKNGVKRFGLDEYFQQPELTNPFQGLDNSGSDPVGDVIQVDSSAFDGLSEEEKQLQAENIYNQQNGLQPIEQAVANIPQDSPMDTPIDNSLDMPDYTGSNDTTGLGAVFGGRKGRIQQLEKEQQQQESGYYDALENAYKKEPQVSGGKIASALMLTLLPTILARTSGNKALLNASAETAPMTVKTINDLTAQDTARQQKLGLVQAERLGKQAQTTEQQLDRAVSAEERYNDQQLLMSQKDVIGDGNRVAKGGLSSEDDAKWKEYRVKSIEGKLSPIEQAEFEALTQKTGRDYLVVSSAQDANRKVALENDSKRMRGETFARSLPEKSRDVLDDTARFNNELEIGREKLAKLDSVGLDRLSKGTFDPNSNEAEFNSFLESLKRSYAMAKNKGALSETDVKAFDPLFAGSTNSIIASYRSKERFEELFKTLQGLANKSAKLELKGALANKVNPDTVKDIAYAYNINLDDSFQSSQPSPTATGGDSVKKETKIVNGVTYEKVTGGWQKVKNG